MHLTIKARQFLKTVLVSAAVAAVGAPANAAVISFSGYDAGAGSLAAAPTATAAAASFDGAFSGLSIIDFESATPGFSVTGDGFVRNTQRCAAALCGYNTTSGGANFLDVTFNTTFHFTTAIDTFGAYFTGVQQGNATLTYTDGSTTVLAMPAASLSSGGTTFFGFSDAGASITSIAYFTGTGGDFVGVDDIRYGSSQVPAPATLALFGLGLLGFGWSRRKA
jgi:hypothetical protein